MKKKILCIALIIVLVMMLFVITGCGNEKSAEKKTAENNAESSAENQIISETESYVGYYADIDNDGEADGVIYADLAVGGSGKWNEEEYSAYEFAAVTSGLKEYYVKGDYNGDSNLGTVNKIISPVSGATGEDRFYIMALEDFTKDGAEFFTWYYNAYKKLDSSKNKVSKTNDFGEGKANTIKWIEDWNNSVYGEQTVADSGKTYIDILGAIQNNETYSIVTSTSDTQKWFIPSKAEWSAFGDYMASQKNCTYKNLESEFNLSGWYCSSTQYSFESIYCAHFSLGYVHDNIVNTNYHVRLSATF